MSSDVADNHHEQEEEDSTEVANQHENGKISIKFNHLGEAVGPKATHFRARVGKIVKTHAPISFTSWLKVPQIHKNDIWNDITREFEVPSYLRENIEKSMSDAFRKKKTNLRDKVLDKYPTLEAQKLAIPEGINKEVWEQFCINESDEKQKEIRAKASESRKCSLYGHTGGRKSAAMVQYEMAEKRRCPVPRSEVWIATHTKKNGSVLPGAISLVEQVKEKVKFIQSEGNKNVVHPLSIDDDPLTQILGKRTKGLPGVGSFVSKKKYNATLHSYITYSEEKNKNASLENTVGEMKTQLDFVVGHVKEQMIDGTITHTKVASMPMTKVATMSTPQTASRSSSPLSPTMMGNAHGTPSDKGDFATLTPVEPTPTPRFCELLDWNINCVALAKEITDPIHRDSCHNYRLNEFESKVSMSVRKIYTTKLYKETPDAKIIQDVGIGDFLVWPKSHIIFHESSPTD